MRVIGFRVVSTGAQLAIRRFPGRPRNSDFCVSLALAHEVARGGYDLVHVQGVHPALPPMALTAASWAGIPTVVTFHTGGHSSRLRTAVREAQWQTLRPLLRRADALIAVCRYEVEQFARRLGIAPKAIQLIRNGAEPLPVATTPPEISGSPLICSVGRLERYKGHHRVVDAMPALLDEMPEAHLALVGRGAYEGRLRQRVAQLGVGSNVTFHYFESSERPALGAIMRSSDIATLLSEYEANPVAVMEALALGTRVIVADTSGLAELDSVDLVTPVPTNVAPVELAEVLARVARLPPAAAPDLPSWDDCVDRLLGLYGEMVGRTSLGRSDPPGDADRVLDP